MKLTSRGFTLVELMIVIAIIGILAAALFPSMTGYLKRSRDTARISHLKDISTALGAFYSDKERYPTASGAATAASVGILAGELEPSKYLPKGLPVDPVSGRNVNGAQGGGNYGYSTGSVGGAPAFASTAVLENDNGWNIASIAGYHGTTTFSSAPVTSKGAGSGYVLSN